MTVYITNVLPVANTIVVLTKVRTRRRTDIRQDTGSRLAPGWRPRLGL